MFDLLVILNSNYHMKQLKRFIFVLIFSGIEIMSYAYGVNIDGIYYLLNGNKAIVTSHAYGNTGYNGNIIIPESVKYNGNTYNVTSIDEKAFFDCKGLESVIIPNNVTSIGSDAFYGCNLKSVIIPHNVTSIGSGAFAGCHNLTSITIPDGVSYIGSGAFFDTTWYNNQPDGIVYAGKVAFCYKGEISRNISIIIQDGTRGIAGSAFRYIGQYLTSITIPQSVLSIGEEAFYGCSNLKSISVPNNVRVIGHWAFEGTAWLNNQQDGVVYAGKVVYQYKGKMPPNTKIQIKEGTLGIAGYAFSRVENMKSITIPQSVTNIGFAAFDECKGLTSITIPNSVTTIEGSTFRSCSSLTSVSLSNSVTSIGNEAFAYCNNLKSIVIPNDVALINEGTFWGCSSLTSIIIPNNVTTICYGAFQGCSELTSVTIPNRTIFIGGSAFRDCWGLSNVTIPNSVISIGNDAFSGTAWYNNQPDGLVYIGKIAYKYKGTMPEGTNIDILEGTKEIQDLAFRYCKNLTSISIPNSIKEIGDYAFDGCTGLTSITIPNSVKRIGSSAFSGCTSIRSIIIPQSVNSIGYGAFSDCSGLSSVNIFCSLIGNDDIIDNYTFKGCDNLRTVVASTQMINKIKDVFSSDVRFIAKDNPEPIPSPTYNYATLSWLAFQDKTTQKEYQLKIGVNSDSKIENVTISVNGTQDRGIKTIKSSDYDLTINRTLTLNEGTNIIKVSVRNAAGTTQEEKTIVYRPQGGELPTIEWLDFAATANKKEYQMKLGIKSKTKIEEVNVTVNGEQSRGIKPVQADGYDLTVDRTLALSEGINRIVVSVRNGDGIATSEKVITYQGISPTPVFNDKRIAFVVGNSHYSDSEMNLPNPENDARDVAEKLKGLGFEVILKLDATLETMDRELSSFKDKAKDYDVAMFYYAGHGIQNKGVNYIIPTNIQNLAEDNLKYKCVNMERVLDVMEDSQCKLKIVVLDACRNDPVSRKWHRSAGTRGLSIMNAPTGTIISFSTSPGSTALDGTGRNSPYTQAFLNTLEMPNLDVFHFFQRVGASVMDMTHKAQNPWLSVSFTGDFYFNKQ